MLKNLDSYREVVGDEKIDEILREARPLKGKYIVHVNSTFYGGGVAEILDSLVVLMNQCGIKAGWRLLKGSDDFFRATKLFHNGCQGAKIRLSEKTKKLYEETNRRNSVFMHLEYSSAVIIHDPQVLPLINCYERRQPWIWRCHIDASSPNEKLWQYLKKFIRKYDAVIISDKTYHKKDLRLPQTIIMPSIDPLSEKNKKLSPQKAKAILKKIGLDLKKPIVSQISRYDYWKDPLGVLEAFRIAKKKVDCQLVLLGNFATDDPEGDLIFRQVQQKAKNMKDVTLLVNVPDNDIAVNALQTVSKIVLQKSLKEGFALTVSEALWKGTPVIGGRAGGIPNQIKDGKNGYLVDSIPECAERIVTLMQNEKLRKEMGRFGHEYVKENFLITRHLLDYIKLLKKQMVRYYS